jgi:hypothetical protein
MKAFKRKPEDILAERFDGTPESAKIIIDWMKTFEDEELVAYNLRLKEEYFFLGSAEPEAALPVDSVGDIPELTVVTTKARYYLTPGNWMVRSEEGFKTSYDDFIAKHYDEV